MAKRLLKDWTASTKIDAISPEAEVFFTRLIMKADDYGSFHGNPRLLRSALFPLREVTIEQIGAWVFECVEVGLIFPYEADGKEFLRIHDFGQRLRSKTNVFPHPADNALTTRCQPADHSLTDGRQPAARREEKRREIEGELADALLRGRFTIDSYPNGKTAFEEIQSDEQMVERLLRVVRNEGYPACDEVAVMKAVRRFITAEEAKPDFKKRPRDDIKKHLVNWIRTKAKTINAP